MYKVIHNVTSKRRNNKINPRPDDYSKTNYRLNMGNQKVQEI